MRRGRRCHYIAGVLGLLSLAAVPPVLAGPGEEVILADRGRAQLPVVVGEKCSPTVRSAAEDLSLYLGRISGAPFEVKAGDGTAGIVVGLPGDFGALPVKTAFDSSDPRRCEEYLLQSDGKRLYLLGATETAVEDAVWDLLYRLGYRQFFPGRNWEIIPSLAQLRAAVNAKEGPDYKDRRFHYLLLSPPVSYKQSLARWAVRNRVRTGFRIESSHIYQGFYHQRKEEFQKHPEYLPVWKGERTWHINTFKPCLSNADCRRLIVGIALERFEKDPKANSISMEPSDGGNWCVCEECKKRSPSDWVVILANEVAKAVNEKYAARYGTKYVGILAYNFHADPPSVRVDPRVAVTVTMTMRVSNLSLEEIIAGWRRQGAEIIGLDYNTGGENAVRDIVNDRQKYPRWFREQNIHRLGTAGGNNWGSFGLGAYFTSRILWDVDLAEKPEIILDDFFSKAFGKAAAPMRDYFGEYIRLEEGSTASQAMKVSGEAIGRMYRALESAMLLAAEDAGAKSRIGDMATYTRCLELNNAISRAKGEEKDILKKELASLAHRAGESGLFPLLHETGNGCHTWLVPSEKDPRKAEKPLLEAEIRRILKEGVERNKSGK